MVHPYNDIIANPDFDQEYISRINLADIFTPIFEEYKEDIITARKVILFILYGYSIDSQMLSIGGNNWGKVSNDICEKVGLPAELYNQGILLGNVVVRTAIQKWLEFQNDEHWKNYITCRDLRYEMLSSALSPIKTASDEINYEQKMKNAIHAKTLLGMMNEEMENFIQNHPKLKSSAEALNRTNKSNRFTRGPGDYAYKPG